MRDVGTYSFAVCPVAEKTSTDYDAQSHDMAAWRRDNTAFQGRSDEADSHAALGIRMACRAHNVHAAEEESHRRLGGDGEDEDDEDDEEIHVHAARACAEACAEAMEGLRTQGAHEAAVHLAHGGAMDTRAVVQAVVVD